MQFFFPKLQEYTGKRYFAMDQDPETSNIPANAQCAEDVDLPEDAAERKRVLNILAQRRYRTFNFGAFVVCLMLILPGRRRREKQATLESLVGLSHSTEQANFHTVQRTDRSRQDGRSPHSDSNTSNITSNTDSSSSNNLSNSDSTGSNTTNTPVTPTGFESSLPGDALCSIPLNNGENYISEFLIEQSWNNPGDLSQLNDFLQTDDIQNATFADDFHIAVPELDLLRAAYENSSRMHSTHLLFAGLTAQSVFQTADCSNWMLTLPDNLMPTGTQLTCPHHPAIDILPWPAVRNRLIKMYSMPADLWPRHPSDGTQSSLVRFVYDMEDGGIRVTGPDPAKETAWEIDQTFFENWWWALDQAIVSNSNLKRLARGQSMLCAPSHGT